MRQILDSLANNGFAVADYAVFVVYILILVGCGVFIPKWMAKKKGANGADDDKSNSKSSNSKSNSKGGVNHDLNTRLDISFRKQAAITRDIASGVSSIRILTPVAASMVRILRPSRPMMRPFISSFGNGMVEVVRS